MRSFMRGSRREETGLLETLAQVGVSLDQRAADTMTDRAGLAAQTTAADVHQNVHVAAGLGQFQGLANRHFEGFQTEILVQITLVDHDLTVAGDQTDTGDGRLTTSYGIVLKLSPFCFAPSVSLLNDQRFGLLSGMLMLRAGVDLHLLGHLAAQRSLGQHADDGVLNHKFGLFVQKTAIGGLAQAARKTAVLVVNLLVQLLAVRMTLSALMTIT